MIASTKNVKVKLSEEEKKTSVLILHATPEDEGTYVCKATSDIGLATTKAKLRVSGMRFIYNLIFILTWMLVY